MIKLCDKEYIQNYSACYQFLTYFGINISQNAFRDKIYYIGNKYINFWMISVSNLIFIYTNLFISGWNYPENRI